jgi:glycerol-3-phosphate dehydrogenase
MGYTPHILVVGGGATGTALARDLAMRGLEVTLVEQGRLTSGATGRTQGLLHSGARYAETDPESAGDCFAEGEILRDVASNCVESTGGLFVSLADDDGDIDRKREACDAAGIETTELTGTEARDLEPALAEETDRALRVPDGTVDPYRLTVATARSARNYGATIETRTGVSDVIVENGAVAGVEVNGSDAGTTELDADYVVNAAGAWAGKIADMAGLDVPLRLSQGAMAVMDDGPTERVLTRCRSPDEGNTLVPYYGRAILGTTDRGVDGPDAGEERGEDVDLLVEELAGMVPELADARPLRAYWGGHARFTGDEAAAGEARGAVVDHENRDGVWGMSSVVGGTLTTHRLVAERVADHVCAKFGIDRACLTAEEPLPGSGDAGSLEDAMADFGVSSPVAEASADRLGDRTAEVLATNQPNPVLCPCESVTRAEVRAAIDDDTADPTDLGEIRIRTRAGMGTCQGGRCCHTLAAQLYPAHDIATVDRALDEFYQERWDGQRHALWGDQLAGAMETYARHAATMNRDKPPGVPDIDAFDSGPEWDEDDVNPRGGGFRP